MRVAFNFLFLLSLSSHAFANQDCLEKRYVFDIGSGSTKSKAYLVDICQNKLVENLGEINKPVHYQQCISGSHDKKTITEQCLKEGVDAIKAIENGYGIDCGKERCKGVATAWARNAINSTELLGIFKQHDIHIHLISQKEEGELGFKTALIDPHLKGVDPNKLLVWDIGGGSFQLASLDGSNEIYIYEGPWGLFNFSHEVEEQLNIKGDKRKVNYYNKEELDKMLSYASDRVGKEILKDKIVANKLKTAKVVGIGRIMYVGIKYELELQNPITKQTIKELIYGFSEMTVEQAQKKYSNLPDHFAPHIQQALILIYGVMEGAGIDELEIIDSTLTDHLVLDDGFWDISKEVKLAQQSF